MNSVTSADGTKIAYDAQGAGPALIVVDGALCHRWSGSKHDLVDRLASRFTVLSYDRRGRGDSGDVKPYAVEREIDDLRALVRVAGGAASLYGHSSGGCLALETAAALGESVTKLAMYEAPYDNDPAVVRRWTTYLTQLGEALATDRRGDAVALFMAYVGNSSNEIQAMRHAPFWAGLEALAPTLAYDHSAILGKDPSIPYERARRVAVPTLVMHGDKGAAFMASTARELSQAMASAEMRILEDQTHNVDPGALASVLWEFLAR